MLDFFRLDTLRRNYGENIRHWARRLALQYSKVGQALNASNSENCKEFLHENIRGILLAETSGLTSSEFESVLATSDTTGAEGESIGNSWNLRILQKLSVHSGVMPALAARDAKARKSEAVYIFDLSGLSEAASRIENAQFLGMTRINKSISVKMMTMNTMRKMLIGTLVTVMTSWMKHHTQLVLRHMTQNFLNSLMAIWKTLKRSHLKCVQQQVAVFKKHVSFCLVSRVLEASFLLLALVLFNALAQPSTDRKRAKSRGKGKKGKREILFAEKVESRQTLVHLTSCQNHRPHVPGLVFRCPRSVRRRSAQLMVDHITLLVFVLISACCVDKLDIMNQNIPTGEATALSPGKRAFGTCAFGCAVFDAPCYGATVEETEQDQDENDIEDFVAFSIKSLETRMTSKTLLLHQSRVRKGLQ